MGVKDPLVTKAEVLRARRAYEVASIDPAGFEPYAVAANGEDWTYAPTTAAGPAAKIAKIWGKMNAGERDWFNQFLTRQVGEIPDTLSIDVGAAALAVVEAAKGSAGAPRDFPGLREAVLSLAQSLKARGYDVEPGRLRAADPVVVIDNIDRPISGARMCSIMTQETWQDRLLGGNDQGHVSTRTLWLANGNNLEFREDMSRRAILCTMDAGVERPAERKFDVDLKVEVPRRRGELVPAALTILRAYIVAGRPGLSELTAFGSFEAWSDLVRAPLVWLGEPDPCETRAEVASGDSVREELSALTEAWAYAVGVGKVVSAAELLRTAQERANEGPGRDALLLALESACPRGASPKAVGWYLKKVKGRIVNGRRIVAVAEGREGLAYRVEVPG